VVVQPVQVPGPLFVKSIASPVQIFVPEACIAFVSGKVKIAAELVVAIGVTPSDLTYAWLGNKTQPRFSLIPPEQLAVVHALRVLPSAIIAL
jgi:hypothetical protein